MGNDDLKGRTCIACVKGISAKSIQKLPAAFALAELGRTPGKGHLPLLSDHAPPCLVRLSCVSLVSNWEF